MEFSYFTRKSDLSGLEGREFDVLVVGGGIVGAGIANILAANNLKVILVDKGDFASGTSSNSSKLIHGGLRYLAQGHFILTRQLLKERNYLMEHLDFVKGMNFDVLIDDSSWSKTSIYFGLILYNLLGGKLALPHFRKDGYSYDGFRGRFTYEDASTDDAVLVIHNIVSSVLQGGTAINYLEATSFEKKDDLIETTLVDGFENGTYKVKSRMIVNAAGPWVNSSYSQYTSKKIDNFRLSKGSHLILKGDKFNMDHAAAFRSHIDRRQMFIIPKGEVVIVGTTDRFVDSPSSSQMDEDEKKYILDSLRKIYPSIDESDVIGSYSGIRPLYGSGDDPGSVTRNFHIDMTDKMLTVMGVKITDYRRASRSISKHIGFILKRRLNTEGLPKILYRRDETDPLDSALRKECALTVDDVIRRRLGYYYSTVDQGKSRIETIERRISDFKAQERKRP